MRILIAVIVVLSGLWSGYWFIGSSAKHGVLETWLNERRQAGWTVAYSDFSVVGFPNRFDSIFTDLNLEDPISGLGWKAPVFHILALSYQPNHIIASFANEQIVSFPLEEINVVSSEMLASVTFEPNTLLAVSETLLRSKDLKLEGSLGWQMMMGKLDLSTRQSTSGEFAHDVVFDAEKVTPTKTIRVTLDPTGRLPQTVDRLYLDMILGFDAPWDRVAVESGAPEVTLIRLNRLDTVWGALGLAGRGELTVAKDGEISGRLDLEIRNWREVLDLFVTSGILDQGTAGTVQNGLALLTAGSDNPTSLKVPLSLKDGKMALGPIPLGYAPRIIREK